MAEEVFVPFTDSEVEAIVSRLAEHTERNGGSIPKGFYEFFRQLFTLTAIEMLPVRINKNGVFSAYFMPRKNDPVWKGKRYWHSPGMMATKNRSFESTLEAIRIHELGGAYLREERPIVGNAWRMNTKNGPQTLITHVVEVPKSFRFRGGGGRFFPIDRLPTLIDQNTMMVFRVVRWILEGNWKDLEDLDPKTIDQLERAYDKLYRQVLQIERGQFV